MSVIVHDEVRLPQMNAVSGAISVAALEDGTGFCVRTELDAFGVHTSNQRNSWLRQHPWASLEPTLRCYLLILRNVLYGNGDSVARATDIMRQFSHSEENFRTTGHLAQEDWM
jgi:hypothetical protein